jgi:hypothetical protein
MQYTDVFGIRIYQCQYRIHHDQIYENRNTGERIREPEWITPGPRDGEDDS